MNSQNYYFYDDTLNYGKVTNFIKIVKNCLLKNKKRNIYI